MNDYRSMLMHRADATCWCMSAGVIARPGFWLWQRSWPPSTVRRPWAPYNAAAPETNPMPAYQPTLDFHLRKSLKILFTIYYRANYV